MNRSWTSTAFLVLAGLLAVGDHLQAAQNETASTLPPPRSVDSVALGLEEPEEDPIEREEYWRRRRGDAPPAEIVRAQEKARRLPQAPALPRTSGMTEKSVVPGGSPWVSFGPTPIGYGSTTYSGRVRTIAVDPTNPNVVYAGAAHGGVWKSTNGGASWTPMSNEGSQPTLAMGSIAVDPRSPNVIYAGTGEPYGKGGRGILKSSDGGASWTLLGEGNPFPSGSTISYRVLVNAVNGTVWVASSAGLIRSTNGTTFSRVTALPNTTAVDVAMSANGMRLYAAMLGWGIYRSNDGGVNWQLMTAGLPDASLWNGRRVRIAIAPSDINVGYVLFDSAAGQTWFTTDGGNNWSPMAPNPGAGGIQQGYNQEIAVDPLNPALVYIGAISLTVTTTGTGGGGGSLIPGIYHVDQHAITFPTCTASPCPFYLGNDGGVYYMVPDPGNPSSVFADSKNTNLSITEFVGGDIGINFVNDPRAIGGAQDNATQVFVRNNPPYPDNPLKWSLAAEMYADGGKAFLVQDPANPNLAYGTRQGTLGGPSRSDFWGYTDWSHLRTGLAGLDFYPAYDLDRNDRFHLAIASGGGVYEIVAPQTSWSPSSQNLGGNPSAVAIAPSDGRVIYAGVGLGMIYRKVSGEPGTLSDYALRNSGLSGKLRINSIAVDSSNPNIVFVAGAPTGSLPATARTVYKSIDGGEGWTNASGNLPPALPIYSIITYLAGSTRVLVIGTDAGVYFSTNEGQTWQAFNNGLPNIAVVQLALDRDRTTIAAFTPGRGAFSTSIAGDPPTTCRVQPTFTVTPLNTKRKRTFEIRVVNNDLAQAECAAGLDFRVSFEILSGTWKSKPKSYTTGVLPPGGGAASTHVRDVRVWPTGSTTGGNFVERLVSLGAGGQPNGVYDRTVQGFYDPPFVGETTPVDPVREAPFPSLLANGSEEPSVTIPFNGTASLTWSSVSATSCSLTYDAGVPAGSGLSGSLTVGPLTASRLYSLICWNGSQSAIDSILFQVQGGGPPLYEGYVDSANCTAMAGWAADRNRLNTSISVDIYDGTSYLSTVAANQSRPDVGSYLGDNGLHGFTWTVPASLKNGLPHNLYAKYAGTASNLGNTPRTITCSGSCTPTCSGVVCGSPNGCGGTCNPGSGCFPGCTPQCSGHYCGNGDGCGGICGFGSGCASGCNPACNGVACGELDPACGDVCQLGSGCF